MFGKGRDKKDEPSLETPDAALDADASDITEVLDLDAPAGGLHEGASADHDPGIDVEDTLKEISARMSELASSVEGLKEERSHLENKMGDFEDRMVQLGTLAEAVSSQYNPFLAKDSPEEPAWGVVKALEPSEGAAGLALTNGNGKASGETAPANGDGGPASAGDDGHSGAAGLPADVASTVPFNLADHGGLDPAPEDGPGLNRFARNMLLLEWMDYIIKRVGRGHVLDLLEYYHRLGWLDNATKDQALRVAVGMDQPREGAPAGGEESVGWRGDIELHETSLFAMARLQGADVAANSLDSIRMDLSRIFNR